MNFTTALRRLALLTAPIVASVLTGCAGDSSEAASAARGPDQSPAGADANREGARSNSGARAKRAIEEADIVQLEGGRLYALSKTGSVSIIDVSLPGRLSMLGQAYIPGEPFEMYLRDGLLTVMTNDAYAVSGSVREDGKPTTNVLAAPKYRDPNGGAGVIVIDVEDPGLMRRVATFPVAGEIADSRVVGNILYLATYENTACYRCGSWPRTLVTTFDLSSTAELRQVDQAIFESGRTPGWMDGTWKRSIFVTGQRMYIGGHADLAPWGSQDEGLIDVIDISNPTGVLGRAAYLTTTGPITSRWQMDEKDGVLRVVSQRGIGYVTNGVGDPTVETFQIGNTRSITPVGKLAMHLPRQEALKTVRFDGPRAYAITFAETDPLFVLDLANPAKPIQCGEILMPGWVFHLEPFGTRLLGLGLDRNDRRGHLNVSLFDVADMDHPKMLQRVAFGSTSYANDQGITSYELPEDQDRIQKAFRVLEGGLIVAPYSGGQAMANSASSDCSTTGGGVQLVEWRGDALVKQASLPISGNPRRALLNQGELLAVSDSNVSSFNLARRDIALKTADLVIGGCEASSVDPDAVPVNPGWRGAEGDGRAYAYGDDQGHGFYCSATVPGARGSMWAGLLLGLVGIVAARRRR